MNKDEALEKKAENARELGLNYEPEVFSKQNYLNGYCVGQSDLLAEQAKQEPVAWMRQDGQRVTTASDRHNYPDYETRYSIPLYTTPPQRKPLSEEEIGAILEGVNAYGTRLYTFARAIEAAHGIKGEA